MARYRIKEIAAGQGMPLTVLARKAEVDQSRLYNIANNNVKNVTIGMLESIAGALGVRLVDLIEDEDDPNAPESAAS